MLGLLLVVFMGMGATVLAGRPGQAAAEAAGPPLPRPAAHRLPPLSLVLLVIVARPGRGHARAAIQSMVREAADYVGGRP